METKAPEAPTTRDVWMRGLFMLLFIIAFWAGQWLLNFLALVQFLWLMFAREPNQALAHFGSTLSLWLAEIGRFLTCATNDRPFPWRHWPDATPPLQVTSSHT